MGRPATSRFTVFLPPSKGGARGSSPVRRCSTPVDDTITTPAGFTITPEANGSYRICDPRRHCLTTQSLWEAQQLVQWAEVHHQDLSEAGQAATNH
ncbi:MAG: hypothetical protein VKN83_06685 [Cyanobacteriota bacterium]|nr:hypothetical protein [Cyanobacteriota bacterium]